MADLSIIVPIYNGEAYLRECLDSIINQSYRDFELICVDDGSTDTSAQILDEYKRKDSRIQVIHKENGGLVSARKTGVKAASGEWIGYVDCDDWIDSTMYEEMIDVAKRTGVDMVSSSIYREGNYTTVETDTVEHGLYDEDRMQTLRDHAIFQMSQMKRGLLASVVLKLFKASILKEVQCQIPDNISIAEDFLCTLTYLLHAKTAYSLDKGFYHYRLHGDSMTHQQDYQYLNKVADIYQYISGLYQHPMFSDMMRQQSELYVMQLMFLGINKRLGFSMKNFLMIDPYWLDQIPAGKSVVLYGCDDVAETYWQQLKSDQRLSFSAFTDLNGKSHTISGYPISLPQSIAGYDYIVITIKNEQKAKDVRNQLCNLGIEPDKILWFEQKELQWKYAKAAGMIPEK